MSTEKERLGEAALAFARQLAGSTSNGDPQHNDDYFWALRWGLIAARRMDRNGYADSSSPFSATDLAAEAFTSAAAPSTGEPRWLAAHRASLAAAREFKAEQESLQSQEDGQRLLKILAEPRFLSRLLKINANQAHYRIYDPPSPPPAQLEQTLPEAVKLNMGGKSCSGVYAKAPGNGSSMVLTAWHCVKWVPEDITVEVYFPSLRLEDGTFEWDRNTVRCWEEKDLAAFSLRGEPRIEPRPIISARNLDFIYAAGFGKTSQNSSSGKLTVSGRLPVMEGGCANLAEKWPHHKCANTCGLLAVELLGKGDDFRKANGSGLCDGDSGGPAYLLDSGKWDDKRQLVAINTCSIFGTEKADCGPGGIFTPLDENVVDWLSK